MSEIVPIARRHTSAQVAQRSHTSELIVKRSHTSEQIGKRSHTSEQIVKRSHTIEQIVERSRRSTGENHVNRDHAYVTVTVRPSEIKVVGTPSQVGRLLPFFQGVFGADQRTATSSSRRERLPQVPHKSQELLTSSVRSHREPPSSQAPRRSQVVEDFSSTRAVINFPRYERRCQTSSSANHSTAAQATHPTRHKSKDGATTSARRR